MTAHQKQSPEEEYNALKQEFKHYQNLHCNQLILSASPLDDDDDAAAADQALSDEQADMSGTSRDTAGTSLAEKSSDSVDTTGEKGQDPGHSDPIHNMIKQYMPKVIPQGETWPAFWLAFIRYYHHTNHGREINADFAVECLQSGKKHNIFPDESSANLPGEIQNRLIELDRTKKAVISRFMKRFSVDH
ncbi:uncharacterized protein XB22062458.L isoform X2 [Xenopus laevis]|uniref:Uncharacterized protein XB22062458.L isoform X2 n=1 Tax=Xenopus laevis TaxID=8355 RepID=A0A8J1KLZ8_XENLA|nr:uncharacterized protein XB22062458.L isoform X2 [Xenopus laevis]